MHLRVNNLGSMLDGSTEFTTFFLSGGGEYKISELLLNLTESCCKGSWNLICSLQTAADYY